MGKQIQFHLNRSDERALIDHLASKFPVAVVDIRQAINWDQKTLRHTDGASSWLIVDNRVIKILCSSASRIDAPGKDFDGMWQIRSKAYSCIEWERDSYYSGEVPSRGRLYLNTDPDMIWQYVSAEVGDDVEKCFNAARRWLRKNCINISNHSYGIYASREFAHNQP